MAKAEELSTQQLLDVLSSRCTKQAYLKEANEKQRACILAIHNALPEDTFLLVLETLPDRVAMVVRDAKEYREIADNQGACLRRIRQSLGEIPAPLQSLPDRVEALVKERDELKAKLFTAQRTEYKVEKVETFPSPIVVTISTLGPDNFPITQEQYTIKVRG